MNYDSSHRRGIETARDGDDRNLMILAKLSSSEKRAARNRFTITKGIDS